jgi:proline iminopeptidase
VASVDNEVGAREGTIELEGARLRYVVEGEGPPCLVIGSSFCYPRVFPSKALRRRLQMVFVDLRHFGLRDPALSPERVSRETYYDDIEQIRQTLGLGDVMVLGHSLCGPIALEYARRHPLTTRGVVAVAGHPARGSEEASAAIAHLWDVDASAERKSIYARRQAELTPEVKASLSPADLFVRDYVASGAKSWYDADYDCTWLWDQVVPDMPMVNRLYGELFKPYDLADGAEAIGVPALVVHGRYDYLVPYTLWERRLDCLRQHTYVLLEQSAHFPSLEQPELFDETFLGWLDRLAAG